MSSPLDVPTAAVALARRLAAECVGTAAEELAAVAVEALAGYYAAPCGDTELELAATLPPLAAAIASKSGGVWEDVLYVEGAEPGVGYAAEAIRQLVCAVVYRHSDFGDPWRFAQLGLGVPAWQLMAELLPVAGVPAPLVPVVSQLLADGVPYSMALEAAELLERPTR